MRRLLERTPTLPTRIADLTEWLYQHYFIGWRGDAPERQDWSGSPWFVADLTARCAGATYWASGFRLHERNESGAFVRDEHGLQLWVADQRSLRPPEADEGEVVSVRVPCAHEAALPGFFALISRAGHIDSAAPHLKLYVNVTPDGALGVMEGLVKAPALRRACFEAKTGNEPTHFGRRDSLLIYAEPRSTPVLITWLSTLSARHRAWFRDDLPPMTKRVARGVGLAESPPHGEESFGAHRCRLIAEGLSEARAMGVEPMREVALRFERERLDWAAPHRGLLGENRARGLRVGSKEP